MMDLLNLFGSWKAPIYFVLLMALALPMVGILESGLGDKRERLLKIATLIICSSLIVYLLSHADSIF